MKTSFQKHLTSSICTYKNTKGREAKKVKIGEGHNMSSADVQTCLKDVRNYTGHLKIPWMPLLLQDLLSMTY